MSPSVCEANTLDLQHQKEDRKIKRIFVKKLNIKGQNLRFAASKRRQKNKAYFCKEVKH